MEVQILVEILNNFSGNAETSETYFEILATKLESVGSF